MTDFNLVKSVHHDIYPFISPRRALKDAAEGRCVLITGAGTGIGKAAAVIFAQASAKYIVLLGRRLEVLEHVKSHLCKDYPSCNIVAERCDVSQEQEVDQVFQNLKNQGIESDILVNNAGVSMAHNVIKESDVDNWWKTLETNVKGPYICSRAFLRQHTPGRPAAIIMTSSIASYYLPPLGSAYGASKVALNRLTEWIACENQDDGVQAIAFHPGGVGGTEMASNSPAFMQNLFTETSELAAGTILYLSTQRAGYLNGRYVDAKWNLEELERFKDRIEREDLLKISLLGDERVKITL